MHQSVLMTIGHSTHEWATFISYLHRQGVTAVADVRSRPYSRISPHFNKDALLSQLTGGGIAYAFLGDELGARRTERECYVDRQARYDLIAKLPLFQRGLERIRTGLSKHRLALLCAEKDPITCHRMVLVSKALRSESIQIQHILEDGTVESNADTEARLLDATGVPREDLFDHRDDLLEEAYRRQGLKIAWVDRDESVPGSSF